jgi:hypothetical protein
MSNPQTTLNLSLIQKEDMHSKEIRLTVLTLSGNPSTAKVYKNSNI